jgi:hypothetical protein
MEDKLKCIICGEWIENRITMLQDHLDLHDKGQITEDLEDWDNVLEYFDSEIVD